MATQYIKYVKKFFYQIIRVGVDTPMTLGHNINFLIQFVFPKLLVNLPIPILTIFLTLL